MLFNSIKNEREQKQVEERLSQAYAGRHIVALKGSVSEARHVNVRIPESGSLCCSQGYLVSESTPINRCSAIQTI